MNFPTFVQSLSTTVVINTVITKKINQFRRPTQIGPKKCPVYLYLPWLGNVSMRYEMQIKTALQNAVTLQLNHALSTPVVLKLFAMRRI